MIEDRKALLEEEIAKVTRQAATVYHKLLCNLLSEGDPGDVIEYDNLSKRLWDLKIDLQELNKIIEKK
jgi:hypothetical protein